MLGGYCLAGQPCAMGGAPGAWAGMTLAKSVIKPYLICYNACYVKQYSKENLKFNRI